MGDARLVLVLGATGYVGGRVVPRLLAAGYRVRCLVRAPRKLAQAPWADRVEILQGDLLDPATLPAAFHRAQAVLHLVHMMGTNPDFERADRRAARHVARAASEAGVERIVYLGGLGEDDGSASPHLRSRAEVGRILACADVPTTVLRAAVIIGSGSASFEMLRHLVDKLPVMVTPRWVLTRVQPIAIGDVLRCVLAALDERDARGHAYDVGGEEVLTYLEMMRRYARVAGLPARLIVRVPVLSPALSSYWVRLVTPVPFGLAKPLVLSLSVEVVVRAGGEDIRQHLGDQPMLPYDEAVADALRRVHDPEATAPSQGATRLGDHPAEPYPDDPGWTGGTLLSDARTVTTPTSAHVVFAAVDEQTSPFRRLRRPGRLAAGDTAPAWRVELRQTPGPGQDGLLRLRAQTRLPARVWLEWRITPAGQHVDVRQRALLAPRGLAGRAGWWLLTLVRGPLLAGVLSSLVRRAEARDAAAESPRSAHAVSRTTCTEGSGVGT